MCEANKNESLNGAIIIIMCTPDLHENASKLWFIMHNIMRGQRDGKLIYVHVSVLYTDVCMCVAPFITMVGMQLMAMWRLYEHCYYTKCIPQSLLLQYISYKNTHQIPMRSSIIHLCTYLQQCDYIWQLRDYSYCCLY